MNNKDIILFILIICVIYLLYCNERKESFTTTSTNVTTTATPLPEDITLQDIDRIVSRKIQDLNTERSQVSITESIKNLGILAKRMNQSIDGQSRLVLPSDLEVTGNIKSDNICINNTCINEEHLKVLTGDTVFYIGAPFSSRSDFYLNTGAGDYMAGFHNRNRMTQEAMQLIIDDFTLNTRIANNGIASVNEEMNNLKVKEGQAGRNSS